MAVLLKRDEPEPSGERPPGILHGSPRRLVDLVPAQFDRGQMSMETILAARTIQAVARARWFEATGYGPQSWRRPPDDCPAALRKAGEALADELLKQ